jgi:acetyl-CoA acetyltransferase
MRWISKVPGRQIAPARSIRFDIPSMTIRTGCSASLMGLNEACLAITRGDCEAAFVGGVNLILAPTMTTAMSEVSYNSESLFLLLLRNGHYSNSSQGSVGPENLLLYDLNVQKSAARE